MIKDHCSSDFFDHLLKADPVVAVDCHKDRLVRYFILVVHDA